MAFEISVLLHSGETANYNTLLCDISSFDLR